MYDHQFIKLKEMVSDEALQEIVNKETKMRIEQHQPACEIKLVDAPQVIPVSYSQVAAEVEHLGIYVCNLEKVESWSVLSGCELKQIKTNEDIEDLAKLDIITTFLKVLVQKALGRGAKIVYLVADEDDTPKEMYLKLGFNKVKDLYTLFWKL